MAYKDKHEQIEYQKRWARSRRLAWLQANGPCKHCGSWDDLEVDHVDPTIKITNRVWGWSEERRAAELAKCQVLCYSCHKKKTAAYRARHMKHGTNALYNKGCRCSICREAHAVNRAEYRRRTGRR